MAVVVKWFAGKHYSLTNPEEVRAAVQYTRKPGHGGKLFLKGSMRLRQQHWNTVDETESSNTTYSVQGFVTAENFAHTCEMRCTGFSKETFPLSQVRVVLAQYAVL